MPLFLTYSNILDVNSSPVRAVGDMPFVFRAILIVLGLAIMMRTFRRNAASRRKYIKTYEFTRKYSSSKDPHDRTGRIDDIDYPSGFGGIVSLDNMGTENKNETLHDADGDQIK